MARGSEEEREREEAAHADDDKSLSILTNVTNVALNGGAHFITHTHTHTHPLPHTRPCLYPIYIRIEQSKPQLAIASEHFRCSEAYKSFGDNIL